MNFKQEYLTEFVEEVGDFYFRSILLKKGTFVPQHEHEYDHVTYVGNGSVKVWMDGDLKGEYHGGQAILVEAFKTHIFEATENDTRLCCVHDLRSANLIKERGL